MQEREGEEHLVLGEVVSEPLADGLDLLHRGVLRDEAPQLRHPHPVVDGGADDADAGAEDRAQHRPVLRLLRLRPLLLVRGSHCRISYIFYWFGFIFLNQTCVGEVGEVFPLALLIELKLVQQVLLLF